jgi:hypothetical protein
MERSAWTDERLDDRFGRLETDLRDLRAEMREGFTSVRDDIHELRVEFGSLRNMMFRSYVALAVALIAAVVVRGV